MDEKVEAPTRTEAEWQAILDDRIADIFMHKTRVAVLEMAIEKMVVRSARNTQLFNMMVMALRRVVESDATKYELGQARADGVELFEGASCWHTPKQIAQAVLEIVGNTNKKDWEAVVGHRVDSKADWWYAVAVAPEDVNA